MKPDRAWLRLGSGHRLDLINPRPGDWTNLDLAVGLSRTYRRGGHSVWDLPLSVAQHSLLVLVLRQQTQPHQPLTPVEALRELLHDADELSSLCVSILSPAVTTVWWQASRHASCACRVRWPAAMPAATLNISESSYLMRNPT